MYVNYEYWFKCSFISNNRIYSWQSFFTTNYNRLCIIFLRFCIIIIDIVLITIIIFNNIPFIIIIYYRMSYYWYIKSNLRISGCNFKRRIQFSTWCLTRCPLPIRYLITICLNLLCLIQTIQNESSNSVIQHQFFILRQANFRQNTVN